MPLKPAVRLDWKDWKRVFPDGTVWGDAVMGEDEVPSPRVNSTLALNGDEIKVVGGGEVKVHSHDGEDEVSDEETA